MQFHKNKLFLWTGIFYENITTDFAIVQQRMYMHQKYIRVFVVDLYAEKRAIGGQYGGGVLHRCFHKVNATTDIKFNSEPLDHNANW